jgi:tetratricopeptide (TPR) repeat protein
MVRTLGALMLLFLSQAAVAAGDNPEYTDLLQRARAEYRDGRFAASETLFLSALGALQGDHGQERAVALFELGQVYASRDELPQAERAYSESLAIFKRFSDKASTARLLHSLGAVYSFEGRADDAQRTLKEALKLAKASRPFIPRSRRADIQQPRNSLLSAGQVRQGRVIF